MRRPPVSVRIDELVLIGFGRLEGERVATAAGREIERLAAAGEHPWPAVRRDAPLLQAPGFQGEPGGSAEALGAEVGRAVYRRLGR